VKQQQFLDVVTEEVARARFHEALGANFFEPRRVERPLSEVLGCVLAEDVRAPVDVPGFDRSNVDGFAIQAPDSYGAEELEPRRLRVDGAAIAAGADPTGREVREGWAIPIATGAVVPRGADAVVMIEDTSFEGETLLVTRAVAPGAHIAWAGTDLGRGEVVLPRGSLLGARDTGLLAAIGLAQVPIVDPPRVAVISTGDELVEAGATLRLGQLYESNARMVCDAVREAGGEPRFLGIVPDNEELLRERIRGALVGDEAADMVVLSGGTSKGAGDLNAQVVEQLARELEGSPGIVVHGVALKPGKPLCLAVLGGRPVAILPGFPTSAIFTFHEFLAPLIRRLAGRRAGTERRVEAVTPLRIPSVGGRTQYTLVNLVPGPEGLAAYPLGSGSGSVSTFARADGFLRIDRLADYLAAGSRVSVRLLDERVEPADLVAIGSHCIGLDWLLSRMGRLGFRTKSIVVGSTAGLAALARGEGDVAGTHLLCPESGIYNESFLTPGLRLLPGYRRRQGVVFRQDDGRFRGASSVAELSEQLRGSELRMVNRNRGSGTRLLIDGLLGEARPAGYGTQARSHHAVAAAVAQGRADWGLTLDILARDQGLGFLPLQDERYDFAIPESRWERPALCAMRELLASEEARKALRELGLEPA